MTWMICLNLDKTPINNKVIINLLTVNNLEITHKKGLIHNIKANNNKDKFIPLRHISISFTKILIKNNSITMKKA